MRKEELKDIALSIWENRYVYHNYITDQLNILYDRDNTEFQHIKYSSKIAFTIIEWLSSNISNNIINQKWFRIDNENVYKLLDKNLKITNFYDEFVRFLRYSLAFGSWGMIRYRFTNKTKTVVLTKDEWNRFKKERSDDIISVEQKYGMFKVKYKTTYINPEFKFINPFNIAFSSDMEWIVRKTYLKEDELKRITRKIDDFNEIEQGAITYYEVFELYHDSKMYILNKDFEVVKKYNLPVKLPFVYFSPYVSIDKLGFGITEVVKDNQFFQTIFDRAMLNNVIEVGDVKYIYDPRVISKKDIDEKKKYLPLKTEIVDPRTAMTPIMKSSPMFGMYANINEYLQYRVENTTGFTRYSQGLDAKSLNKTATGVSLITQASRQRIIEILNRLFKLLEKILYIEYKYFKYAGIVKDNVSSIEIIAENFDVFKQHQLEQLLQFLQILGQFGAQNVVNVGAVVEKIAKLLNVDENLVNIDKNMSNINEIKNNIGGKGNG